MALTKASLILVFVAVCALMGSAIAAEAPAPSPTSGAVSVSRHCRRRFFRRNGSAFRLDSMDLKDVISLAGRGYGWCRDDALFSGDTYF
ncbi:hypothetical protein F3Y22_tig00110799pilonHSYRG00003 [Hibiscus syriacus]|uniref:Uncharacterized protein n=1 Tax=Hibiscus syriacus TaxID=106335 RepID=A0A6A2ZQG3_HIBSY|nr:hypothetical protein F3Y22_tig00110799pilonHSYRG00003 [Hibiscus syriacus]